MTNTRISVKNKLLLFILYGFLPIIGME